MQQFFILELNNHMYLTSCFEKNSCTILWLFKELANNKEPNFLIECWIGPNWAEYPCTISCPKAAVWLGAGGVSNGAGSPSDRGVAESWIVAGPRAGGVGSIDAKGTRYTKEYPYNFGTLLWEQCAFCAPENTGHNFPSHFSIFTSRLIEGLHSRIPRL